jgi:hypothetical protein
MGWLFGQGSDPPKRMIHPFEAKGIDYLWHTDLHQLESYSLLQDRIYRLLLQIYHPLGIDRRQTPEYNNRSTLTGHAGIPTTCT